MALDLLVGLFASMLAQPPAPSAVPSPPPPPPPSIEVEVRNAATSGVIEAADVVMDVGTPPTQRRRTRRNGRIQFQVVCSEDVKFWAELPGNPNFSNQSPPVACQPQVALLTLKLRPNRRRPN